MAAPAAAEAVISRIKIERKQDTRVAVVDLVPVNMDNREQAKLQAAIIDALADKNIGGVGRVEFNRNRALAGERLFALEDQTIDPTILAGAIGGLHAEILTKYAGATAIVGRAAGTVEARMTAANTQVGAGNVGANFEFELEPQVLEAKITAAMTNIDALVIPPGAGFEKMLAFDAVNPDQSIHGRALEAIQITPLTPFYTLEAGQRTRRLALYDKIIAGAIAIMFEKGTPADEVYKVYAELMKQRKIMLTGIPNMPEFATGHPELDKLLRIQETGPDFTTVNAAAHPTLTDFKGIVKAINDHKNTPAPAAGSSVTLDIPLAGHAPVVVDLPTVYAAVTADAEAAWVKYEAEVTAGTIATMPRTVDTHPVKDLADHNIKIVKDLGLTAEEVKPERRMAKLIYDENEDAIAAWLGYETVAHPTPPHAQLADIVNSPEKAQYRMIELRKQIKTLAESAKPEEKLTAVMLENELIEVINLIDSAINVLPVPPPHDPIRDANLNKKQTWEQVKGLTADSKPEVIDAGLKAEKIDKTRTPLADMATQIATRLEAVETLAGPAERTQIRKFRIGLMANYRQVEIYETEGEQTRTELNTRLQKLSEKLQPGNEQKLRRVGEGFLTKADVRARISAERAAKLVAPMEKISDQITQIDDQLARAQSVRVAMANIFAGIAAIQGNPGTNDTQKIAEIVALLQANAGAFSQFNTSLGGRSADHQIGGYVMSADLGNRDWMTSVKVDDVKKRVNEEHEARIAHHGKVVRFLKRVEDLGQVLQAA